LHKSYDPIDILSVHEQLWIIYEHTSAGVSSGIFSAPAIQLNKVFLARSKLNLYILSI